MSVSVRVVDCVYGRPAVDMAVRLMREVDGVLTEQWRQRTNDDGRISGPAGSPLARGAYALELDLEGYFCALGFMPVHSAVTARFRAPGEGRQCRLSALVTPSACMTFLEG
ncbi:MAG TPA: hydroxyisourate hydrolase [Streptosporangiaceae bacterium]|nr:hydroxyisourate hydrolase [Streptosporangiaceae bacterium]